VKYLLIILAVFSFSFSCKTKKALVPSGPIQDTLFVEDPTTGSLSMQIVDRPETADGEWVLNKVENKFDPEMKRVSLKINAEEKAVEGFDGCNSYFGNLATFTDQKIKFGALNKTERECMVPAKYAKALYANFKNVSSYSFTSYSLSLKNSEGTVLLMFSKKD
jgi:heat shock protein HslJ